MKPMHHSDSHLRIWNVEFDENSNNEIKIYAKSPWKDYVEHHMAGPQNSRVDSRTNEAQRYPRNHQ